LTQTQTPTSNDVSLCDTSLVSLLRRSLFQLLTESLRRLARTEASRSLRQAQGALRAGSLDIALRTLDRAWRRLPEQASTLAPIYGRLLALEARDHNATLGLLQRAIGLAPDPDVAALFALTLLRLERFEDARRNLEVALVQFCVAPGGLLFHVAGKVMQHPAIRAPGWIGRGPNLELVGELSPDEPSNVLDIRIDGQTGFSQLLRRTSRAGRRTFSFPSPPVNYPAQLEVSSRGAPLLGSGSRLPSDFDLDGRAACTGNRLTGWARMGWLPSRALRLRIEDDKGHRRVVKTGRVALLGRRWPIWINVRAAGLRGSRIRISVQLPDGRWHPLPDSPLLLEPAVRLAGRKPLQLRKWSASPAHPLRKRSVMTRARWTDIIIPVYRGREETLACIESALGTLDPESSVTVVDDATDDPALAAALDALAADGCVTLLRNAQNLGFVASVNRALALNPTHDVVLLNSDTLVFDDWLARLRKAAYSGSAVGTVTPLSNSGSIASYPHVQGAAVSPEYAAALHVLATSTHPGTSVEIPVGVGFCLFMRRDCLRDVGALDAAVFGKGYGEETDFCVRARRRGWSHRLAADVYVYHAEGVSFGSRRAALLDRSQRLINLRHPGYDGFIASFQAQDPLQGVRRRLDEHRLSAFQGRFVLIVTLAMSGGVERFVSDRCKSLRAQGLFPLVLRPANAGNARRCDLWTDAMELPNLRYDIPKDLHTLTALLGALRLEAIEIQHFLHLDARVIEAVRALPIPYDVFVHDYSWFCPRVTLIDGSGRYCGEPPVSVCQSCVRRNGSNLGEAISVPALRARSAIWLRGARHVIAPSADTATRLQQHFDAVNVDVQPHTPPIAATPLPARAGQRKVVRVALIGAIGVHKGYQVLLDCARDARARRLPIEFVVIGYTSDDAPLLATGKVFITGRYSDGEAPHLLRREEPDVAWLPSVWPETWCYTLDYALGAGLPVLAFDLGAIAERLRAAGTGTFVPLGLPAGRINDRLLHLGGGSHLTDLAARRSVQSQLLGLSNDANMRATQSGKKIQMNKTSDGKPSPEAEDEALSASVQVLPLPSGLYLFSVKAASAGPAKTNGQLSLPAVHVGLGPGVRPEEVEFMSGPSTHGAWLFAEGDLLVTRVNGLNGIGATLIMTSVRAPGGEVLSIKVERLEARADAAGSAAEDPESTALPPPKRGRKPSASEPGKSVVRSAGDDLVLPVQIAAHIRARGDMTFADVPWAGRVAPGLWIESFSVRPLKRLDAQDIEYKGLTGSGFETPWLSDDKMCGTKGMAVPLVGFAARLKPGAATAGYDCEYSGYFQSGVTVGPLRNGAPCRSTVANDPLEGIQVRLTKRISAALPSGTSPSALAAKDAKPAKRGIRARSDLGRHAQSNRRQSTRRP
jgi:GT2 family glycosyltransferase/glycosyltransferase involved in cell wall biosynthesis